MFKYAVQTPKSDFCFVVSDVRKFGNKTANRGRCTRIRVARHLFGIGGSQCFLLSIVLLIMLIVTSHVDVRHWGHQSFRSFSSGWVVVRRNFCLSCRIFFFFLSYVWILLGDHFGYAMRRNRTRVGFLERASLNEQRLIWVTVWRQES